MRIVLNLLPPSVVQRRRRAARRRVLIGLPLIGAAAAAGAWAVIQVSLHQARAAVEDVGRQLQVVQPIAVEVLRLQAEIADLEERRRALAALAGQQVPRTPVLDEISRTIPHDAWLQSLTIDGQTVSLGGQSLTLRSVAEFASSLEASPVFSGVRVASLQQVSAAPRPVVQFRIDARLEGRAP
ncbi:MAG: PilN domain-containing protein [Armatimonadota bacterium]|nr:PilN domain-containing protein [Armatimonadota bacterium]MDR7404408.1 PilN domain-containing protein [Armatimonadota bacterium]